MKTTLTRAAALVVLAFALAVTTPAYAETPRALKGSVTDRAAAIGAETPKVQAAVDRLAKSSDLSLSVVYVRTFGDIDPKDWARQTIALSGLGADDLVLVIATDDRRYAVETSGDTSLSRSQIQEIANKEVRPAVRKDDWGGAAIEAADAYRDADTSSPPYGAMAGGAVIILGFGALLTRSIRRGRVNR